MSKKKHDDDPKQPEPKQPDKNPQQPEREGDWQGDQADLPPDPPTGGH